MPMRAPLQAAAAAAAVTSSRRNKGRRRDEYGDGDSDEEATLLGESERDPGFEHNEEESRRTARSERAHDAASQVRAEVVIPSSPLYNLMWLAPSAIDVSERVKGQISYCSLTAARCVGISMRLWHIVYAAAWKLDKLQSKFAANIVRNQKYNVFTFLPIVFYEQFKFFFNLYFLLVALSQFIPALRIGGFAFLSQNSCCLSI